MSYSRPLPKPVRRIRLSPATLETGQRCRSLRRALGEPATWDGFLGRLWDAELRRLERVCRARGVDPASVGIEAPAPAAHAYPLTDRRPMPHVD